MPKFVKNVAGQLTEESTLSVSAGAGSSARVPELNGAGILDSTIVNSKNTSAGAGDAGKLPALNASGILDDSIVNASVTSSANKLAKLDGTGRLDVTVLPVGVGPDTDLIQASENLAAGDFVNVWNSGGNARVRKADASSAGKEAWGFVLSAVTSGLNGTVYFEGSNTAVTGLTPGRVFLDPSLPGRATATAPTTAGQIVQLIGVATSATKVNFQSNVSITLA